MSGQYVKLVNHKKWGWMWEWGRETFYDEQRHMITFTTPTAARAWLHLFHPHLLEIYPDASPSPSPSPSPENEDEY